MKKYLSLLVLSAFLSGCAWWNMARTTVSLPAPYSKDGKMITYTSDKEQINFDVKYEGDGKGGVKSVRIKTDKSGTSEAALEATMAQQATFNRILDELIKAGGTMKGR